MLAFVVGTWEIMVSISSLQGADMFMTDLGRVVCVMIQGVARLELCLTRSRPTFHLYFEVYSAPGDLDPPSPHQSFLTLPKRPYTRAVEPGNHLPSRCVTCVSALDWT
jgi:hypothetical protein